ncbi:heavy-metal-associated domain-containing protein [Humibacter ginsenosidimutans]
MITNVSVSGMSCEHCVNRVRGELLAVSGVSAVEVSLETGAVTIESGEALQLSAVRDAVVEAGYELVGV